MEKIHRIIINSQNIPSNVFFAPINPGLAPNGTITNDFIDFFLQRSGNDIGICYIGNVAIRSEWVSNHTTSILSVSDYEMWEGLSKQIRVKGSVPGIQLAWKPNSIILQRSFYNINREDQLKQFKDFYNSFQNYEEMIDLYSKSILFVIELGFSVVQIHAAHGYALSLLLSRTVSGCDNPRFTKGAIILEGIMSRLAKENIISDIRISLFEGLKDDDMELKYKYELTKYIISLGFNMISISNGFYNIDKKMIYPSKNQKNNIVSVVNEYAKLYPGVFFNISGNMEEELLYGNSFLHNITFSLGRQLIVDPKTVSKMINQECYKIIRCNECNNCHYYSHGVNKIQPCSHQKGK